MTGWTASAILVPIVLGLVLLFWSRLGQALRILLAIFGSVVPLASSIVMAVMLRGQPYGMWYSALLSRPSEPMLVVDGLVLLFVLVFSLVWVLALVYSAGYLKDHGGQHEYYGLLLLLLGSVVGLCAARNLALVYLFWEVAGIATWRLVAFYRGERDIGVATKTLVITFVGSTLMLVGFAAIFVQQRTLSIDALSGVALSPGVLVLVLCGIVAKSASVPFYIWLPDAHSVAPSPVSALLSGVVAKIGLLVYLRVFAMSGVVLPDWWPLLVAGIGAAGSLIAAGCALSEMDFKRVLALSTVSQLGYVFVGLAFGGRLGIAAGIIYMVAHCLAKASLFLALGMVERSTGLRRLDELGGLWHSMPLTATLVGVLMMSVIGLPPLLGFFGKFYVVLAAVRGNMLIAVAAIVAAVLTAVYLLRVFRMFLGQARAGVVGREPGLLAATVAVLALVSVAAGILLPFGSGWLGAGLTMVMGR